jgi:RimJ/RimL family protein N-acetyltransferase
MAFDLQPILKGGLVELRPLQEDDFDILYAVAQDPLIWEQHPNRDRYREEVFREFFRGAMESGGAFLVRDAKTGAAIGSSRFYGYDKTSGEIEIGWTFLARSHWGRPYNREMKRLMLGARVPVRRAGGVSDRPGESAFAAGSGENRRSPRRISAE